MPPLHGEWKEMKTDEGQSFYVDLANMKIQWERPRHGTINSNSKTLISKYFCIVLISNFHSIITYVALFQTMLKWGLRTNKKVHS